MWHMVNCESKLKSMTYYSLTIPLKSRQLLNLKKKINLQRENLRAQHRPIYSPWNAFLVQQYWEKILKLSKKFSDLGKKQNFAEYVTAKNKKKSVQPSRVESRDTARFKNQESLQLFRAGILRISWGLLGTHPARSPLYLPRRRRRRCPAGRICRQSGSSGSPSLLPWWRSRRPQP